ncbi:MAG: CPBP family intramembrane glutamic endopeptidase [Thermoplasmatota archaeon]
MAAAKARKAATAKAKSAKVPAKSRPRAPVKAARKKATAKRSSKASAPPKAPVEPAVPKVESASTPGWLAVDEPAQTTVAPAHPMPVALSAPHRAAKPPRAFDPATGDWIAVPATAPAGAGIGAEARLPQAEVDAPDAPKEGTAGYVLWSILLWIDLALLGFSTLVAIGYGAILLFAPDSAAADSIRDQLQAGSRSDLVVNTLVSLVAFGLIPVLWLLGTRRKPVEGTMRFLHLHEPAKGVLRGVLLTIPLLMAVTLLVSMYTVATEGWDGLSNPDEGVNPAVQEIIDNLTWPIAVLVAVGAGVGEEIFFRGFLQRYLGVWGQAVLFGLAHSTGGYLPQVLFAFGLGILFGLLVKRGWSLWSLIVAHTLYDFTLLAMALVAPESV